MKQPDPHSRQVSQNTNDTFVKTQEPEQMMNRSVENIDNLTDIHDQSMEHDLSVSAVNLISEFQDKSQPLSQLISNLPQQSSSKRVHPSRMMSEFSVSMKRKLEGVDVKYRYHNMCTEKSPGRLLQKMSFDIDLKSLYQILDTCSTNELNQHCPVIVAVNDQNLQKLYGGAYLIQVWNNSKQKIFERVSDSEPDCWSIIGDSFVFQLNLDQFDVQNGIHKGYQILKFQGDRLACIFTVKIKNDNKTSSSTFLSENLVAVQGNYLIIANETEIRFLDISNLNGGASLRKKGAEKIASARFHNEKQMLKSEQNLIVKYSDFTIVKINSVTNQKIKAIQEGDQNSCIFICEDIDTGKLVFYKLLNIDLNAKSKFQMLAPEPIEQEQNKASPILQFSSVMIYLPDIKQLKQVGIVLHENLSIDFYYDYQCVEKLVSTGEFVYFDVSISFRQLHFKAFDLSVPGKEKLESFSTATTWKQKIGMTSDPIKKSKLIKELIEEQNGMKSLTQKDEENQWTRSLRKGLYNCLSGVDLLIDLAQKQENFGFLSICSSNIQLFTSFLNTGRKVLVSHDRFISGYSMRKGEWAKNHFDLEDKVRTMFKIHKNEENKFETIGVLVGYLQFRFFEIQDQSEIVLTRFEINTKTPIVQFLSENNEVFYMVCRQTKQDFIKYTQAIDFKTAVHMPFTEDLADEFSIVGLYNNELTTLKDPSLQCFKNDATFQICLQKGNQNQVLIVDSFPQDVHHQVRLELSIAHDDSIKNKIIIISAKEFEIHQSGKEAVNKTGRIIGQLVSQNKIIQVTKNHVLVLQEQDSVLKVIELFEDRNIDSFMFLDDSWLYTLSSSCISYDNELKKPYGPIREKGLYAYDIQQLVDQSQIQAFFLDTALARVNDLIEYDINSQQMAFMKSYNQLKIIPLPHRSNIQLFAMGDREDYLLCHVYKGTFTAVDKKCKMTMWSTATGKVLCAKEKRFDQNNLNQSQSQTQQSIQMLKSLKTPAQTVSSSGQDPLNTAPVTKMNEIWMFPLQKYSVYKANSQDISWMNDLIHGEDSSRSLIVSGQSIEQYKLEEYKTQKYQSNKSNPLGSIVETIITSIIQEYQQNVEMEVFNFKLLEMSQQDTDQETRELDDGTWIKIKFEDMERLPTQKVLWKEKMTFDLKLPVDKEKRPFIYFSQDLKKMMISSPGDPHPVIYECFQLEVDQKVDWKPIKRITRFPTMLQGLCSSNCLFTPNFEFFIDFDFTENQFVIKDTMKEEVVKHIPSGMIKLTLPGKDKSPMQIPVVGSRIMFYSYDEIRILGNDSLDVILKIDYADKSENGLNISSFVAVDNFNPDSHVDRHAFVEKAEIPIHDTFNRLIRKSREFKQIRVHSEIQIREKELKEKKEIGQENIKEILREIAYQELFSVNYLEKGQFSVELSFTILDWLIIKQVLDGKNFNLNRIAPKRLIQMCFNIFPKLQSVLHLLANNFKSAQKQLKYVDQIFKLARSGHYSDGRSLTLPITQDEDLMTPLDICLQDNSLNINMVDIILEEIKDYPLLHSSHLLQSVVCKAIKYNVPCIGEFLDARIIPSTRLENSTNMSSGTIKEELLNKVCGQNVGWGEFSIWESTSSLRQKMFNQESGFQRHLSLSYFDIPSINDLSVKSNKFFEVLADTENINLFKCTSINIIIEKAWAEHRTIFILFFAIPYLILLIAFYFWSNWTSVPFKQSGFETKEGQLKAGGVCVSFIVAFASYFLIQEIYQMQANPRDYFSNMWNILDIGTMLLVLVAPCNQIRNSHYCRFDKDSQKKPCNGGIPEFQSEQTTILMYYVQAAASLALWLKLMYYVRMYKPTSYLVRAGIKVIGNLKTFMSIYLMACFAFTDAFYTASIYQEKSYFDAEKDYYQSWQAAFLETYKFMMAGSGLLDNTQTPLVFFLFFLASIVIYLCLLNLLIASVGAVFGEVKQTQDQYAMQERAQLISDVRSFPITQWIVNQREPETFLFIASYKNWNGTGSNRFDYTL